MRRKRSLERWYVCVMVLLLCPAAEAAVSDPLVAITPVSRSRVHLDVGLGGYSQKNLTGTANHTSLAFALAYEYSSGVFGFNIRWPFGLSLSTPALGQEKSTFLIGDIGMRFRWLVLDNKSSQSHLSIGFEVNLPATLLNTLGGNRSAIQQRRLQDPLYQAGGIQFSGDGNFNMLPIRYLNIGPQLAFAQKIGPVTVGAHMLGTIIIAPEQANWYHYPHVEFILTYEVYGVYDILGNGLIEGVLEFGGNSALTKVASDAGPIDGGTGLTLTLGARSRFARRFEAALGLQIGLPLGDRRPSKEKRGYDFSQFYRHDWSLLFRFAVLLDVK